MSSYKKMSLGFY